MNFKSFSIVNAFCIQRIQETIRRLLHLMPTDPAVLDILDKVTVRRSAASAFATAATFDVARSASTANMFSMNPAPTSLNRTPSTGSIGAPNYTLLYLGGIICCSEMV